MGFEIGYRDGQFLWFKGALSGSNLELFLHELTRKVDNVDDFDKLPIPYRAVATNMVTGKEVVFDKGRLYQAMRASMSVPGMFAPVELDGRILGDGGLVNNLPVDVVRAMGADVVIAVNIGTPLMSRDQLQSVVGYASQMLNILTEQNVRAQLARLAPGRRPDLAGPRQPDVHRLRRRRRSSCELGIAGRGGDARRSSPRWPTRRRSSRSTRSASSCRPNRCPEKLDFVTVEGTHVREPRGARGADAARSRTSPSACRCWRATSRSCTAAASSSRSTTSSCASAASRD